MSNRQIKSWRDAARGLLDRLWSQDCFVCGQRSVSGAVCLACDAELPRSGPACPCCANPSPGARLCGRCLRRPPHFDASHALFRYDDAVRSMVLALKSGGGLHLVRTLTEEALRQTADWPAPDLVLAAPLHPRRLAERGFNQSAEFARALCQARGWPLVLDAVVRDIDTPPQPGRKLRERLRNVRGAFRCPRALEGAHVLVIDDVMTSGATLGELAKTLKASGAASVRNLVVARALPADAR